MKRIAGILLALAAGLSLEGAQERQEPPPGKKALPEEETYFERRNDGVWIKAGEVPLGHFLAFLSDYVSKPLIIADSGLDLKTGKIPVKEEIKATSAGQIFSLIREGGVEVETVLLPNGKEVLEASRLHPPRGAPLIFKPDAPPAAPRAQERAPGSKPDAAPAPRGGQEPRPSSKSNAVPAPRGAQERPRVGNRGGVPVMTEGRLRVTDLLQFLASFQGVEVFCDGSIADAVRGMEIVNVVDILEVDPDIVKEMLECHGVRVREVLKEDQSTRWRVFLTTSSSTSSIPRVIRKPGKAIDAKK